MDSYRNPYLNGLRQRLAESDAGRYEVYEAWRSSIRYRRFLEDNNKPVTKELSHGINVLQRLVNLTYND